MSGCGALVVKDPTGDMSSQVPGVLGMNVIRKCYRELFGQHGTALFDLPVVSIATKCVVQALQKCQQAWVRTHQAVSGMIKVRARRQEGRIPGGSMKIVAATCSEQYSGGTMMFEPLDRGLPAGLLASPALVRLVRGTTYVPVVNVGTTDVLLSPRTIVGRLDKVCVVSLPAGVVEVPSQVATVALHSASPSVQDQLENMDLTSLPFEAQAGVMSLLAKYTCLFLS